MEKKTVYICSMKTYLFLVTEKNKFLYEVDLFSRGKK